MVSPYDEDEYLPGDICDIISEKILINKMVLRGDTEMERHGKKARGICAVLLILGLGLLTACGSGSAIRLGVGSEKGTYYSYAARLKDKGISGVTPELKTTAGSAASLRLLQKGFLDAAIVQSDILYSFEQRTDSFKDDQGTDERTFSAVCGLYTEAVHIIVRKDSGIESIDDLDGKVVSVGEEESGTMQNAEQILQCYGLSFDRMQITKLSFEDSAKALREGSIDAFFATAGAPVEAFSELFRDSGGRLLSMRAEEVSRIRKRYPAYVAHTIEAGTYENQDEEALTVGVRAVLVAANDLESSVVEKLTETVYLQSGELNGNIAGEDKLTPEEAVDSIVIPFHPGAAAFLSTQGIEVQVDDQGKSSSAAFGSQDQ